MEIEGQLNAAERRLITEAIVNAAKKPLVAIEVGTWLRWWQHVVYSARLGAKRCWSSLGYRGNRAIYERMPANIRAVAPTAVERFTPLLAFRRKYSQAMETRNAALPNILDMLLVSTRAQWATLGKITVTGC